MANYTQCRKCGKFKFNRESGKCENSACGTRSTSAPQELPGVPGACSEVDFWRMTNEGRIDLTAAFHSMLERRFSDTEFGYQSFPDLRYDEMVLSTIFSDLLRSGQLVSAGHERFRLAPAVVPAGRKRRVRPEYPAYMFATIPDEGRSFEVDEDAIMVAVGEFDCPVCHANLGDRVPSHGPNLVVRFHRAHGVHFWWSLVPHCGKKLLISNSGM